MSLDIRIRTAQPHSDAGLQVALQDDGYYWFLYPLFERLGEECGKILDLYGGGLFTRDDFPRLRQMLDEAQAMAERQPESWQVHVGTELQPTPRELYKTVQRARFLELITTLRTMVDTADRLGGALECIGD